jgi:drug/metabolite transporter (DMT)-like permease
MRPDGLRAILGQSGIMSSKRRYLGVVLMMGASLAFCASAVLVKSAAHIDAFKTVLFRFVFGLGLLGTLALFGRIRLRFVNGPLLFLRGLTGGAAVFLFYLSIVKLGVAKGTVISHSYPIFASMFGAVFLKERVGLLRWGLILCAIAGMYLLSFRLGAGNGDAPLIGPYELLAILGAVLSGVAVVTVRKLHDTDSTYAIFFAQCAIGLWLVVVPANVVAVSIGWAGGLMLLGIGTAAATGQLLMTEGYRYVDVTTGSLLNMLVPVLNFIIGLTVFKEAFRIPGIVGALLILVSCAAIVLTRRQPSTDKEVAAAQRVD